VTHYQDVQVREFALSVPIYAYVQQLHIPKYVITYIINQALVQLEILRPSSKGHQIGVT